jgi:hypothetical protein
VRTTDQARLGRVAAVDDAGARTHAALLTVDQPVLAGLRTRVVVLDDVHRRAQLPVDAPPRARYSPVLLQSDSADHRANRWVAVVIVDEYNVARSERVWR